MILTRRHNISFLLLEHAKPFLVFTLNKVISSCSHHYHQPLPLRFLCPTFLSSLLCSGLFLPFASTVWCPLLPLQTWSEIYRLCVPVSQSHCNYTICSCLMWKAAAAAVAPDILWVWNLGLSSKPFLVSGIIMVIMQQIFLQDQSPKKLLLQHCLQKSTRLSAASFHDG